MLLAPVNDCEPVHVLPCSILVIHALTKAVDAALVELSDIILVGTVMVVVPPEKSCA